MDSLIVGPRTHFEGFSFFLLIGCLLARISSEVLLSKTGFPELLLIEREVEMKYISTRGGGEAKTFSQALIEGLAPDGGLYVPDHYPQLTADSLRQLKGQSYQEIAFEILRLFVAGSIPDDDLRRLVLASYTPELFGSNEITPVFKLSKKISLLKLSEGPMLAFKCVPLQLVENLMEYELEKVQKILNVLGATSGDTGASAEGAAIGKKWLRIFMLQPLGRVSRFQRLLMTTLKEPNIFNLLAHGTFDDCQNTVKEVNADLEFKRQYNLGAINSINWARIAAQVVYYVYAYLQTVKTIDEWVTFVVPSGNFGNALSAYIAGRMGLNIRVIVATNENDVLDEFFRTGLYRWREGEEVVKTSSPSMDIAQASNFERFIFDTLGREPKLTKALWEQLKLSRKFRYDPVFLKVVKDTFSISSGRTNQDEVLEVIRQVWRDYFTVIDPHTAVAMGVALRLGNCQNVVVTETAKPAKFADTIKEALGVEPEIPERYRGLSSLPEYFKEIEPDADMVKKFIAENVSA